MPPRPDRAAALRERRQLRSDAVTMSLNSAARGLHEVDRAVFRAMVASTAPAASQAAVLVTWLMAAYLAALPEADLLTTPALGVCDNTLYGVALRLVLGSTTAGRAAKPAHQRLRGFFAAAFQGWCESGGSFSWPRLDWQGDVVDLLANRLAAQHAQHQVRGLLAHLARHVAAATGCTQAYARFRWAVLGGMRPGPLHRNPSLTAADLARLQQQHTAADAMVREKKPLSDLSQFDSG